MKLDHSELEFVRNRAHRDRTIDRLHIGLLYQDLFDLHHTELDQLPTAS